MKKFLLLLALAGCGSGPERCAAEGGHCAGGGTICIGTIPSDADSCNPNHTPAGTYCCIGTSCLPAPDGGCGQPTN